MNLKELLDASPEMFAVSRDSLEGEPFMLTESTDTYVKPPWTIDHGYRGEGRPILAVDLACLYTEHPESPVWEYFIRCADTDSEGGEVYLGGVRAGRGLQIRQVPRVTADWGSPLWEAA